MTDREERATAATTPVDVSGSTSRPSPASLGRITQPWRPERACACGGLIRAESPLHEDVYFAVGSHNRTSRHEEWRRWMGR